MRRQAERRLVENEQLGLGHQTAADGEHLLLAARQRAGALRAALEKAREDGEHARAVLRAARGGAAVAAEIEILAHRQVGEHPPPFRHLDEPARDDCRRLLVLDRFAVEADRAGTRAHDAGNRPVERRLADPVGAEHGDDLARLNDEVDAAQYFGFAVAGAQAVDGKQRVSGHGAAPSLAAAPWPR